MNENWQYVDEIYGMQNVYELTSHVGFIFVTHERCFLKFRRTKQGSERLYCVEET